MSLKDVEDITIWREQVKSLNSRDGQSRGLLFSTMSFERLFQASLISPEVNDAVHGYLEILRNNARQGDSSSDSVSDTANDAGVLPVRTKGTTLANTSTGFDDLPPEVRMDVVGICGFSQRASLAPTCVASADAVSQCLRHEATRILLRFNLKFESVRLMQTATGTAISGSAVTALLHPTFTPGDLDFIAPRGQGKRVVTFLEMAGRYCVLDGARQYTQQPGLAHMWTLTLGNLKLNVMEVTSSNPLDCITNFHLTCVYGAWFADSVWHGYPGLTESGVAVTTPTKFPLQEGLRRHKTIWNVLQKYTGRGFVIGLNELDVPHCCGVAFDCPATIRTTVDKGCSVARFPVWPLSGDAPPIEPISWTMGGMGCSMGTRMREGRVLRSSNSIIGTPISCEP
ncbi:hypothetical protein C8R47DRAFT_1213564 [Mycena vitilis]|nr:hypothetical protein C8R47DRAFT_1213564 [Mycena vitilis]